MASLTINPARNVVPNWRDYRTTSELGELNGNNAKSVVLPIFYIDDYIKAWQDNKTVPFAGDLISAAIMGHYQETPQVIDAANFIIERKEEVPDSLFKTAVSIIPITECEGRVKKISVSDRLDKILNQDNINKERIGFLRKMIHRYPFNPVWYSELALAYTKLGLNRKAVDSMSIAIHLAPNSRYISRSAARLFLHIGDMDRAHDVLIRNSAIASDPWIVASEIGVNALRGRSSRFMKSGILMVDSGDYSAFSVTELASAIGSIEFYHSRKKCKSFINKALIMPNDNSLSQAEWLLSLDNSMKFTFSDYSMLKNKYEADARKAFLRNDYSLALEASISWIEEMPFAKTPIDFAANMAFTFKKEYDIAIKILEIGLKSNQNEPSFLNNLAYSYAMNGMVDIADKVLNSNVLKSPDINNDIKICVIATKGLSEFRKGNVESGRNFYKEAISLANYYSMQKLMHKAILNYIREELIATKQCDKSLLDLVDRLHTGDDRETLIMRQDIRDLLAV